MKWDYFSMYCSIRWLDRFYEDFVYVTWDKNRNCCNIYMNFKLEIVIVLFHFTNRPINICKHNTYLLTYWLTPWIRVLLEKLSGFLLVKKYPAFYRIRRFITAFTSARHLSLSWTISIQFIPLHPASLGFILILSSHLRLGLASGLFPSGFPTVKNNISYIINNQIGATITVY